MLAESGTGICFVSSGNGERLIIKPNDTAKHSLSKIALPHPFHLAGTQTALPSVPVPTRVSFVVVPAPFLDSKTFFPGKKVLAWFLCERFFARAKKCGKNTIAV